MDTIDWLEEYAPGFQALSKAERRAITEFLFLWSLFEAKVNRAEFTGGSNS